MVTDPMLLASNAALANCFDHVHIMNRVQVCVYVTGDRFSPAGGTYNSFRARPFRQARVKLLRWVQASVSTLQRLGLMAWRSGLLGFLGSESTISSRQDQGLVSDFIILESVAFTWRSKALQRCNGRHICVFLLL